MIQFPKRTQCFSFPALDVFPARRNIHIEILKSLTFSISSPSTRVWNITNNKFGLSSDNV